MLRFETAIGTCALDWSDRGLTSVSLLGVKPGADADDVPEEIHQAVEDIQALLAGEQRDLTHIRLDPTGVDDFRQAVYDATRAIPPGETKTYGEIAKELGEPGAARAVGAALGANPYPIVVPCHRVLAADGSLHGFSAPGGIRTKRTMLEIERAPGFLQVALFS